MNKVILMGRLTRDPKVTWTQGEQSNCIARFSLAVDRRFKRQGEDSADFINCVTFGKTAEFAEKYLHQGTKVVGCGRIQTGRYTNNDGKRVYTTDVVLEEVEFAESKAAAQNNEGNQNYNGSSRPEPTQTDSDGFMQIPDGIEDELPFN